MRRPPMSLATAQPATRLRPAEQIVLYILFGIACPAIVWAVFRAVSFESSLVQFTLLQVASANLAAWYVLSRLRTYARSRLLSYVLPANAIAFGLAIAINSLFRLNFSVTLFWSCLAGTLIVSYLVTARIRHANPYVTHFLIPGGSIGSTLFDQGFHILESSDDLTVAINENKITGSLVADLHHDHPAEWERLLAHAALRGIPVYHYRLIEEALTGEVRIDHLRENDLGSLIPNLPYMTAKRALDVVFALLGIALFLPVLLLVAIAIKIDSRGTIFFLQERMGFRGKTFLMIKFRTMDERLRTPDVESQRQEAITEDQDSRITRVGRHLRKFRIDELPQIWNVLKGEMSWIGPRPEAISLSRWYEEEIPFYSYRHIVRPGITGWAQVNQGHVADLESIQAKLRLDFYYVKNLSLWIDVLIAFKTLRVVLQGIGAK